MTQTWGTYSYNFSFRTHGESLYQTSVLYAEATSQGEDKLPIPVTCKWFRIRGDRTYQIDQISSNIYQLNAEDIGCQIKVEATPIDNEEGEGTAYGQFGPVQLDPSARQILEQVLGTGGSQFPVTIAMTKKNQGDEEYHDAKLFISQHLIKICFENQGASVGSSFTEDVISLKYTIDFPRVEMHPFDTSRFLIYYDKSETVDAHYDFNKCIDLKALSRQSRDLISLSLKCFSAQTYLMNSRIISSLPEIPKTEQSVADLLLELELVKKELSNQIYVAKGYLSDRQKLRAQLQSLEEEMQVTIQSYRCVLEEQNNGDIQNQSSAEITVSVLSKEKSELQSQVIILNDQIDQLGLKLQDSNQRQHNLLQQIEAMGKQVGIPKSQYQQLESNCANYLKEISLLKEQLKKQTQSGDTKLEGLQTIVKKLETENSDIRKSLARRDQQILELENKLETQKTTKIDVLDSQEIENYKREIEELNQQNSQLLLQRKNLSKSKDSLQSELSQMLAKFETLQAEHRNCAETQIQTQKALDQTLQNCQLQHKIEKETLQGDLTRLVQQNTRISQEIESLQNQLQESFRDTEEQKLSYEIQLGKKSDELQQVVQQLRKVLAQKSIKKLSEVIGIKKMLTVMALESESSSENELNYLDNHTQTEQVQRQDQHIQTDAQHEMFSLQNNEDEIINQVDSNKNQMPNKNVNNNEYVELLEAQKTIANLNKEILQSKQLLNVQQMETDSSIQQLRQQLQKKDDQILSLSQEMQMLAIRLCAAQEQLAEM